MREIASRMLAGIALMSLAAHFFRAGLMPLAALSAMLTALLFVRSAWADRILQAALVLGALEWLRTAWVFAAARAALGQPYGRLLVILGSVAIVTAVAAWLLSRPPLRNPAEFR